MKGFRNIILIPTYNEKESIGGLLVTLLSLYPEIEIWVIDDNSPDGTRDIVEEIISENPRVRLIKRDSKEGLGAAYKHALSLIKKEDNIGSILTMDADGSHDPNSVGGIFSALDKFDLSVGSRYVNGGKIDGWDKKRLFLSWGGNIYVRTIIGFPIKDSTAGFNAFRKSILDKVDLEKISSFGYSYQIEFKNALVEAGATFTEVPITFTERKLGKSKVSVQIVAEGILTPLYILIEKIKRLTLKKYAVGFFMLFALFFATYKLTESPSVWYDEGVYFQVAQNVSHGQIDGLIESPDNIKKVSELTVGYPLIYPLALILKVFGSNIFIARLFMALWIMLLVVVGYRLSRRSFGSGVALFTIALVATFPPLYGNGKSILGEVPGLVYLLASLLFLHRATGKVSTNKNFSLIITGVFAGLCIVTKPIFILLVPAMLCAIFVARKRQIFSYKNIFTIILSAMVPFIVWLFVQFKGASISTIIGFYSNPQPGELFSMISVNLKNIFSDVGLLYLVFALIVWSVSVWLRFRRKIKMDVVEIAGFVFSILIFVAFLRTAGYYRYLFPAQIVSLVYFSNSIAVIFESIRGKMKLSNLFEATIIPVLIVLLFFAGTYQLMFRSWVADYYTSHKTEFWINYFENNTPQNVLFYDVPEVAMFLKSNNYSQYLNLAPAAGITVGKDNIVLLKKASFDEVFMKISDYEDMKKDLEKYYRITDSPYKYVILTKNK